MSDQYPATQTASQWLVRRALKRAGLAVLFFFVLLIPAVRRLRRRLWIWTALRAAAVTFGAWLLSQFIYAAAGAGILVLGGALVLSGLVLRARPQTVSLDNVARQLRSLVVVNGGSLVSAEGAKRRSQVRLFVNPDRVVVTSRRLQQPLLEIPFASMRELSAHAVSEETAPKGTRWSLDVTWQSELSLTTTRFWYEGAFAEHLARVAETTLRSVWKKQLPVIPA